MNYNDGQVHTDFYDKKEDLENIAKEFSEGDPALQNALLELWNKNIKTIACCRGHNEKEPSYISMIIDDSSKTLIQATSEYLYIQDDKIELDFSRNNERNSNEFTIYLGDENAKKNYFSFLHNIVNIKENKIDEFNNIPIYGNYLLDIAKRMNLNCRYTINKDEMMFGFSRPGSFQLFSENSPQLSDYIDSMTETGRLPLVPFVCDKTTLEQFINSMYPDAFTNQNSIQK